MPQGLPVSDVVSVSVTIAPLAAGYQNFGILMLLGSSDVIDVQEGRRIYTTFDQLAADFDSTMPEYQAGLLYFQQSPQPGQLNVGRWAQTATAGLLRGAILTAPQRLVSNFTAIAGTGALSVPINGTAVNVTGLNFNGQSNLNGVASVLQTAIRAAGTGNAGATAATVVWDGDNARFLIKSGTTGAASTVGYTTVPGSGTNVAALFGMDGTRPVPVGGVVTESLISAVGRLGDAYQDWYATIVATATPPSAGDHLAVAAYCEASARKRMYGATITDTAVLDPTNVTDLASQLKTLAYKQTFTQYSGNSPYAAVSLFARAATVNFEANNSTITLKFKQQPGVAPEILTETQAQTLRAKNCNVFVQYINDTAIIQEGVMANGYFFDEVHGLNWLQNRIQTDVYNLLYTSTTKIQQTDDGFNQIVNAAHGSMLAAVNNGLIGPGVWNGDGFGQLKRGELLDTGFYIYIQLAANQPQATRERRIAPPMQIAAKFTGAVHFADVALTVNR